MSELLPRRTGTLFPSTRLRVTATTHKGKPVSVTTYKEFNRKVFFVYVGGGEKDWLPQGERGWFVIDFSAKRGDGLVIVGPTVMEGSRWSLTVKKGDKGAKDEYGVDILDIEEVWHLAYTNKSVVFSNDVFSVSAKRRGLFFPTPEVHRHSGDNLDK